MVAPSSDVGLLRDHAVGSGVDHTAMASQAVRHRHLEKLFSCLTAVCRIQGFIRKTTTAGSAYGGKTNHCFFLVTYINNDNQGIRYDFYDGLMA